MRYFAETLPGIENFAWLEVRSRLQNPSFGETLFVKEKRGILAFEAGGETRSLTQLRTAVSVSAFAFLLKELVRTPQDLRLISKMVATSDEFGIAINQAMQFRKQPGVPTYRIYGRIAGKYPYHKTDLTRAVAFGMEKRYPDWEQSSQKPRLEISISALGSQILCGVRLTDPDMHSTYNHAVKLSSELPPSVAAGMAYLSEPQETDIFLDPMSNDGLFLMERRLAGPYQQMIALTPNRPAYKLAQNNLQKQRKEAPQNSQVQKQTFLDAQTEANSVNKLVADLTATDVPYLAFLTEVGRVLMENGRAIILTTAYDTVKETLRQLPLLEIMTGHSVYIHGKWGRIYIMKKV